MALVACLNDIWNRTLENRKKGKFTWIYMDEFHLFLKSEAVLDFLMSIWKRARKFGGGPTGITQNISDLLKCQAAETIFANSSLIVMLNQAPGDRAALARLLNISESQQQYINNARKGSGLIWTGQAIIPFMDEFPTNTRLYQIMSTNATESLAQVVAAEKQGRLPKEETEQERKDREYEEYQKQQASFYQDKPPVAPIPSTPPSPAQAAYNAYTPPAPAPVAPPVAPQPAQLAKPQPYQPQPVQPVQPAPQPAAPAPQNYDDMFAAPNMQMPNVPPVQTPPAPQNAPYGFGYPGTPTTPARPAQTPPVPPAAPTKPKNDDDDAFASFFGI